MVVIPIHHSPAFTKLLFSFSLVAVEMSMSGVAGKRPMPCGCLCNFISCMNFTIVITVFTKLNVSSSSAVDPRQAVDGEPQSEESRRVPERSDQHTQVTHQRHPTAHRHVHTAPDGHATHAARHRSLSVASILR